MHLVKREMLASAAQGRLAQKDRRIFNSIALAAKEQVCQSCSPTDPIFVLYTEFVSTGNRW